MSETKEGYISLFKAEKKNDNSPNYSGTGVIKREEIETLVDNGGSVRVSLWVKKSNNGDLYMSGYIEALKPKQDATATPDEVDSILNLSTDLPF